MEKIIIGGIAAFVITFSVIPVIIEIARQKKLFDVPDERKVHKQPIPSLGGIGIFIGFVISLLLTVSIETAPSFQFFLVASLILFFVGMADDITNMSALKKFFVQVFVAAILVYKGGLLINNMHGFLGVYQIDNTFAQLFTMLTIVVIINSYNLIDGIDGLAGSIGLITSSCFATFFFMNKQFEYAIMGYTLSAAIGAFLIYNFYPARIFMGDTGSLMLGLINAILAIKFIQIAPTASVTPIVAAPAVCYGILLLPLMDTLRVFGMRMLKGKSPFSPDRHHLHHLLLDRGLSHRQVTLSMASICLILAIASYSSRTMGTTYLLGVETSVFFAAVCILYWRRKKSALHVVKGEDFSLDGKPEINTRTVGKILSFFGKESAVANKD
jgi:UDP-GlcNAc:undecaprenyl-phosphate/decaprenyl-phosphate GlcNAc-1-phosphate transferase